MKVYLYFLIDKNVIKKMTNTYLLESLDHFSEPGMEDYFFYAFTNKKKVAKKFESMRDMSKFYKKKAEMTDDEYEELERQFYSFSKLDFQPLLYGEISRVTVPLTSGEYWYCVESKSESIYAYLDTLPKIPPTIFTKEMQILLSRLLYQQNMFVEYALEDFDELDDPNDTTRDYVKTNGFKNELGLFLLLYSSLVIPDKVISEGIYD